MTKYAFTLTDTAVLRAEVGINAENFQQALEEVARRSHDGDIKWGADPAGSSSETLVSAISRNGEPVPGIFDPLGGDASGWHGTNRQLEVQDIPPEYLAIED